MSITSKFKEPKIVFFLILTIFIYEKRSWILSPIKIPCIQGLSKRLKGICDRVNIGAVLWNKKHITDKFVKSHRMPERVIRISKKRKRKILMNDLVCGRTYLKIYRIWNRKSRFTYPCGKSCATLQMVQPPKVKIEDKNGYLMYSLMYILSDRHKIDAWQIFPIIKVKYFTKW